MTSTKPTKQQLQNDYLIEKLSLDAISKKYNQKSRTLITKLLDEYDIPKRTHSESLQIAKDKAITITKEQLFYDYNILKLTQEEIAKKYGYAERHVIDRLFKKYKLVARNKKELAKVREEKRNEELNIPTKSQLIKLYPKYSISEIGRRYGLHRNRVSKLLKEYEIDITYFKNDIDNNILKDEVCQFSIKELAIKYNTETRVIKSRIDSIPEIFYDVEKLKLIFSLYDTNNQGFSKQIIEDDDNVYNSLLLLTDNHILSSNKITERVYRILNDFECDVIPKCKEVGTPLKFYTIEKGYGNSELQLSRKGFVWSDHFSGGCSKISQELFWEIYKNLTEEQKSACRFGELNKEYVVKCDEEFSKLQKRRAYFLDFLLGNKNLEFDGLYFHTLEGVEEQDRIRDEYLKSKGFQTLRIRDVDYNKNKEKTIQTCLNFLNDTK